MDKTAEKITQGAANAAQKVGNAVANTAGRVPNPSNLKNQILNIRPDELSKKIFDNMVWVIVLSAVFLVVIIAFLSNMKQNSDKKMKELDEIYKPQLKLVSLDIKSKSKHEEEFDEIDLDKNTLTDIYISSSNKSYLIGRQILDFCSSDMVYKCLEMGARYLELDLYEGARRKIVIANGLSKGNWKLTLNQLPFEYFCQEFKRKLFKRDHYTNFNDPVLLFLNLNIPKYRMEELYQIIENNLGEFLPNKKYNILNGQNILKAPLKELMGKLIIITYGKIGNTPMDRVVHLRLGTHVKRMTYKELARHSKEEMLYYNKHHLTIIKPEGGFRSSNYNPENAWDHGCQIVCMNFQHTDDFMAEYISKFRERSFLIKPYEFTRFSDIENKGYDKSKIAFYDTYKDVNNLVPTYEEPSKGCCVMIDDDFLYNNFGNLPTNKDTINFYRLKLQHLGIEEHEDIKDINNKSIDKNKIESYFDRHNFFPYRIEIRDTISYESNEETNNNLLTNSLLQEKVKSQLNNFLKKDLNTNKIYVNLEIKLKETEEEPNFEFKIIVNNATYFYKKEDLTPSITEEPLNPSPSITEEPDFIYYKNIVLTPENTSEIEIQSRSDNTIVININPLNNIKEIKNLEIHFNSENYDDFNFDNYKQDLIKHILRNQFKKALNKYKNQLPLDKLQDNCNTFDKNSCDDQRMCVYDSSIDPEDCKSSDAILPFPELCVPRSLVPNRNKCLSTQNIDKQLKNKGIRSEIHNLMSHVKNEFYGKWSSKYGIIDIDKKINDYCEFTFTTENDGKIFTMHLVDHTNGSEIFGSIQNGLKYSRSDYEYRAKGTFIDPELRKIEKMKGLPELEYHGFADLQIISHDNFGPSESYSHEKNYGASSSNSCNNVDTMLGLYQFSENVKNNQDEYGNKYDLVDSNTYILGETDYTKKYNKADTTDYCYRMMSVECNNELQRLFGRQPALNFRNIEFSPSFTKDDLPDMPYSTPTPSYEGFSNMNLKEHFFFLKNNNLGSKYKSNNLVTNTIFNVKKTHDVPDSFFQDGLTREDFDELTYEQQSKLLELTDTEREFFAKTKDPKFLEMSPEKKKEAVEESLSIEIKEDFIYNILSLDKSTDFCVMRELLGEDICAVDNRKTDLKRRRRGRCGIPECDSYPVVLGACRDDPNEESPYCVKPYAQFLIRKHPNPANKNKFQIVFTLKEEPNICELNDIDYILAYQINIYTIYVEILKNMTQEILTIFNMDELIKYLIKNLTFHKKNMKDLGLIIEEIETLQMKTPENTTPKPKEANNTNNNEFIDEEVINRIENRNNENNNNINNSNNTSENTTNDKYQSVSLNTGTIFNRTSRNNKPKKYKFTEEFTEEEFKKLSKEQREMFMELSPEDKATFSKMAPLQRLTKLEELIEKKSNNSNNSNNGKKKEDRYHRPTILRKIDKLEKRIQENIKKLEEYKNIRSHKRDRKDIKKRRRELSEDPREIEKLKNDFKKSFFIELENIMNYYKNQIKINTKIIEERKKNGTFSEKSRELCLRYMKLDSGKYVVRVMFVDNDRNYVKNYKDDWKILKLDEESYVIVTGDGSDQKLTKMELDGDEEEDEDEDEALPVSDIYDENYFYKRVEMYADLGLTEGGLPGNFQADGSDSGSFKAGDSSKSNSNNSSSNNSNSEEDNTYKWKILAYKEEDCNANVEELPERESTDTRFKKTDQNKAELEEESEVQVSGPVKPKREPKRLR